MDDDVYDNDDDHDKMNDFLRMLPMILQSERSWKISVSMT